MGEEDRQAKAGSVQARVHGFTAHGQVQTDTRLENISEQQTDGQGYQRGNQEPGDGFKANTAHRTVP
ncbi:hypothetical protein D3C76_1863440 [compost metagenome]